LRLVIQWHATFSINSLAHQLGSQPYSRSTSARDSWVTALVTFGEGYHNFHHRFQGDYRNGVRWFHFDPTKWWVWALSKIGLAWDLRRMPREAIQRARVSHQTALDG
jgi:stearoyl-CoA desaturase (delta-9 desaturase)